MSTDAPTPLDVRRVAPPRPHNLETLAGGRYRITHLLGEGGMSSVYGAYDTHLQRDVAIKMLRMERDVHALAREARILAGIRHPNVVVVHALHADERPPFLVMERIDGISLDHWRPSDANAPHEPLAILRGIADGLGAIHLAGLVHGDVKPSNVLVDAHGRVKLIDVGLVPIIERMEPGQILGTPAYIAPERALGTIPSRALAARSDVYSFAVLAFELLTGARPFVDELQAALLHAHAWRTPPRPSDVSPLAQPFDAIFARALSKTASERPASAGAMVDALDRAALSYASSRILVVDDDVEACALLGGLLASRLPGASVETASDGATALRAIARLPRTLALFDLAMPGISGVALIRSVRQLAPSLALVVCTGRVTDEDRSRLSALGVRAILGKPVAVDQLLDAVQSTLDRIAAAASA